MDPAVRKDVLRLIPYGVYAVTCTAEGQTNAFCASWLMQCSFEPPLVAVGVRPDSLSHRLIAAAGEFTVHFMHRHQASLVKQMFQPVARVGNKLSGCDLNEGTVASPILANAVAYLECRVVSSSQPGDHTVFIAEVVGAGRLADEAPLILADTPWHYGG